MSEAKDPEKASAEKVKGQTAYGNKDYLQAVNHFTRALELFPVDHEEYPKCLYNIALSQYYMRSYGAAIDNCNKALKYDQNYIKALRIRARSLKEQNKILPAIRTCEVAIYLDSTESELIQLRESLLSKNNNKRDCNYCGAASESKGSKNKKCAGCLKAYYCDMKCQDADWVVHNIVCKKEGGK